MKLVRVVLLIEEIAELFVLILVVLEEIPEVLVAMLFEFVEILDVFVAISVSNASMEAILVFICDSTSEISPKASDPSISASLNIVVIPVV